MKTSRAYKYHPNIDRYMEMVLSEEIESCQEQKDLIKFLLEKLEQPNVIIDHDVLNVGFENISKHFEFELFEWEKFIMCFIMGVFYDDGSLVFNEFLVMLGRGAGKTGFMSVIEWWLASKQGIKTYHVDIVAASEDQAMESFNDIWQMLEDAKDKYKKFFQWTKQKIVFKKTKSVIRYRTNNAKTKDGGRQGAIVFDEIHAYRDDSSIKVFTSGLGKKPHPRRFYFTTDGNERDGFLDQLKDEAKFVLAGERPNRRTFPFICKLDHADEVDDESKWEKANPSYRYLPHLQTEMKDEYDKFIDRPSARIEFMTKRMNLPTSDSWLDVASWENIKRAREHETPNLDGRACVGAIDYAETTDFASVGLLFKIGDRYYLKQHTFINRKALIGRSYAIPLDVAIEKGLVTIVEEPTIKPETIINWFLKEIREHGYQLKALAADWFRWKYIETVAMTNGMQELYKKARKGPLTHSELAPVVEDLFAYDNLVFCNDDFMMTWYTNNTYKHKDDKLNIEFKKREPKLRKTDGFDMLLVALQHRELLNEIEINYDFGTQTYTY